MQITYPWPSPVLNPNHKGHWAPKAKAKAKQKNDWYYITKETGFCPLEAPTLSFMFCPPSTRRRDRDNLLAACKSGIDGISLAWGIDDSLFKYAGIEIGPKVAGGCVVVTVTENNLK